MDWKKLKSQSIWKVNKEKLIFLFCSGLLLFILAIPSDGPRGTEGSAVSSGNVGSTGAFGSAGGSGSDFGSGTGENDAEAAGAALSGSSASGRDAYEAELEERIRDILKGVEGVGEVDVMVILKSSEEKVLHLDKTTSSSVTEERDGDEVSRVVSSSQVSESAVMDGQTSAPIVEKSLKPEISGIVISADGGGSTVVQTEISEAMEALFGLPAHKIKVLKRVKEGV